MELKKQENPLIKYKEKLKKYNIGTNGIVSFVIIFCGVFSILNLLKGKKK